MRARRGSHSLENLQIPTRQDLLPAQALSAILYSKSSPKKGAERGKTHFPLSSVLLSELTSCLHVLDFRRRAPNPRNTANSRNAQAKVPALADAAALNGSATTENSPIRTAPAPRIAANPTARNVKTTLTHKVVLSFHNSP